MQFQFTVPKIVCAPGASRNIAGLLQAAGCSRILCIYDKGVKSAGIVAPVIEAIKEKGIEVWEFDEVMPDPPVAVVEKAVQAARDSGADGIVSIGGGSTLDTAKLAAALAANPGPVSDYYVRDSIVNPPLPHFAIPTTSGTGSEVTPAAVVSDPELGRKVTLVDSKLVPLYAILDPLLTLGLPGHITAATGMDALSHAVESMTSIRHNPMTDGIALAAIRLIARYLPDCVKNGEDEYARAQMMTASTMAGMAFGNTCAHVGHAFAHAMGAKWHIPHGTACALALPFAVQNCKEIACGQIADISRAVGLEGGGTSPQEQADKLAGWIMGFSSSIGIPSLKKLGINPEDLEDITRMTLEEKPLILLSGVLVTPEDCRAYYQTLFMQEG